MIDVGSNNNWDSHGNMGDHERLARNIDKPLAGLLRDLRQRGMLEDTLVFWIGEFGRQPEAQILSGKIANGRDHNSKGFSAWMAGGGIKPGITYGETDELGMHAIKDRVSHHDLHAPILHLLGLDHERLTYQFGGRDFRLTDEVGRVVTEIIA